MNLRIGLEIHCQVTPLKSKLFCKCSADYRDKEPNTNVCSICMGFPGTLPLVNREAFRYAIMVALALNCKIPNRFIFYRKNYFYPDLPKNFQITQYNLYEVSSIGVDGKLDVNGKIIRIRRIQLEEDPGRLIYEHGEKSTHAYVDYNRAGIALLEIVTEPDFDDPKLVRTFLNKLTSILKHLGINPELEGAVRCDVNVSMEGKNRVEIKNINSFKDVEKALLFEISRQKNLIIRDIEIKNETRHWDDARMITISARTKEEEEDYRYFPEMDIPAIEISNEMLNSIKRSMPELPDARKKRFINEYGLAENVASILVENKELADMFEEAIKIYYNPREIANWIVVDLKGYMERLEQLKVNAKHIAELTKMVDNNTISRALAKRILGEMVKSLEMPDVIAKRLDAKKISDREELLKIVEKVFEVEQKAVNDALRDEKAVNFLLGKVMNYTKGRADPSLTLEIIKEKLRVIKQTNKYL